MYYATVYPIQNYTLLFPVGQDSGFYPEIAGYNRIELSPSPHFGDVFQALGMMTRFAPLDVSRSQLWRLRKNGKAACTEVAACENWGIIQLCPI